MSFQTVLLLLQSLQASASTIPSIPYGLIGSLLPIISLFVYPYPQLYPPKGMGIPEKEIPNIFKRFYRVHQEVNPNSVGIGLSLTKSIIEGIDPVKAFRNLFLCKIHKLAAKSTGLIFGQNKKTVYRIFMTEVLSDRS